MNSNNIRLHSIFILLISLNIIIIHTKEPSEMLTIPLKLINTSFEKYPSSTNKTGIIEEVKIKTIFGTKKIIRLKEELSDISGNVTKGGNTLFVAPINIGGQDFNVVLDTGSVNLWVPKVGSKDKATLEHHYDPKKSSSSSSTSETFEITYGTGSTKGNYYSDYATFISGTANNLLFGAANETNFDVPGADGIMGLARDYNKYMYSAIWTLNTKGYIPNKSFSFKYLGDKDVEMYIGGEHPDFKDINHTASCQLLEQSVYDNLLWTCKLYTFGLVSNDGTKKETVSCGYNFLFDTGSNVMRMPKETLNDLLPKLTPFGCTKMTESKIDYIICPKDSENKYPNVQIEVGDHYFIIDGNEIFRKIDEKNGQLRVQFMEVQISLIGQPFFRLFHTKFDHENKVLKFHTKNESIMIYSSAKPKDDKARHFDPDNIVANWLNENSIKIIAAVAVCVAALFVVIIIVKCGKKACCKKDKKRINVENNV